MRTHVVAALVVLSAVLSLRAQCANVWLREGGVPGANSPIRGATTWDPDGPGPLTARAVVVGSFTAVGRVQANRVAAWDPATDTWTNFGSGANLTVDSALAMPNGDLIVGGSFTTIGGVACSRIALWNGVSWSPLGAGLGGSVVALARMPNGDVIAGGSFQTAGGSPANRIARWNGTAWSAMGSGFNDGVMALAVQPNGTLVAVGGPLSLGWVAAWNGSAWAPLGSAPPHTVSSVLALQNGDLIVGGEFTTDGAGNPIQRVAHWNGTTWSALGSGLNGPAFSLLQLPNGDVLAGGSFGGSGSLVARGIARWNGNAWAPVGSGLMGSELPYSVDAMTQLPNGDVIVAGTFNRIGGKVSLNLARFDGVAFHSPGDGPDREVFAATSMPNGDLVVGGSFATIGGTPVNRIARFDGTSWQPLGSGLEQIQGLTPSMVMLAEPNGNLVVGGDFMTAGGVAARGIGRWNGTSWSGLGAGVTFGSRVLALARFQNGDIVAGGTFTSAGGLPAFGIARWNGASWSPFGIGATDHPVLPVPGTVTSLLVARNGHLYAGGNFSFMNGVPAMRIARFDGSAWSPLGGGANSPVLALAELPNGDIVAGGAITAIGSVLAQGVARWNGTTWSAFGAGLSGTVNALQVLPDGDLVATGTFSFTGGSPIGNIARWDGTAWTGFGSGLAGTGRVLAREANGDLFVGGDFFAVDGAVSARLAHVSTTCPTASSIDGPGCGAALTVQDAAWLGASFRARATGLPPTGFALHATSVTPIASGLVPLSLVFPQALPGCDLLVAPDIVGLTSIQNGTAITTIPLPSDPLLVGLFFYHQQVPVELDGQGQAIAVTATNSLRVTIGAF